jgi:hypothetical protein
MYSPVVKIKYKSMIKNLIQFYGDYIKYFVDVPPDSNSRMPAAFKHKRSIKKKHPYIVTINYNKMLFRGHNQQNPMATSTRKPNRWYVISVNKKVCNHMRPCSIKFIFLHEMIHVRRRVLGGGDFVNREYQDMNKEKARALFDKLNRNMKKEFYNEQLNKHGYDFVMLCHFLTENLLNDKSFSQGLTYDKLIKRIYYYDEKEILEDTVVADLLNEIE